MNIARVIDGVVVNIEVADQAWILANTPSPDGAIFVEIPEIGTAHIGLGWSKNGGFEQPPTPPPSVPGPGQTWALGDIPPGQNEEEIIAELEAILLAGD
jgi:hypothetical protein